MKVIKKIFYATALTIKYHLKIQSQNCEPDNTDGHIKIGGTTNEKEKIPRVIWIYWEGEKSETVEYCKEKIFALNKKYKINIISKENLIDFIDSNWVQSINTKKLTSQQRSDLIRLKLLTENGGIWIDASTILYKSIDWIFDLLQQDRTNSFGFYRKNNTTNIKCPIIESWLLAAEKNDPFFQSWLDELTAAFEIGPRNYILYIKNNYRNKGEDIFQKIGRLEYLTIYIACQVVMEKQMPKMTLINCDKNAFLYQVNNNWDKRKFMIDISINKAPKLLPNLIKLTSGERKIVEKSIKNKKYLKSSLLEI